MSKIDKKTQSKKRNCSEPLSTDTTPQRKFRRIFPCTPDSVPSTSTANSELPCIFTLICDKPSDPDMREIYTGASTSKGITKTLKAWVLTRDDTDLLAKIIVTNNLHAADQVYHKSCHTKYHTKVRYQLIVYQHKLFMLLFTKFNV